MREFKKSKLRTLRNLGIVTALFGGLSLYSFNCAPPSFQMANDSSLTATSNGGLIIPTGDTSGNNLDPKVVTPQALLTSEQVYQSMMNMTGQTASASTAQMQEYDARSGSFAVDSGLDKINSPMMLAVASFAGSVCDGLITQDMAASPRKYFTGIDFNGNITAVTDATYMQSLNNMANSFWGRAPSSDEVALFTQFKTDYIAAPLRMVPDGKGGMVMETQSASAKTRGLFLALCTAVMSSFDIYTY